jgi:acetate kinase
MKVLVLNCGSSSLKYQLFDMTDESVLAKGLVERIGISGARIKHVRTGMDPVSTETEIPNHGVAIRLVLDRLLDPRVGAMKNLDELGAAGHRVVHGGERFTTSVLVDEAVLEGIEQVIPLAPLHNPANLMGIRAMREALPKLPNVVVFDTAFHQTMPSEAYMYGIPYEHYEKDRVRRYGFHGTSHFYVAHRAAELMGRPIEELKIVTCHLGNGSSMAAVDGGKSVDTSLGYGTAEGILMGTRSGNLDPSVMIYLMEQYKDPKVVNDVVHKRSGVQGISGVSSDLRDIEEGAQKGNPRCALALEMLCYGIRKYVGGYAAAMGGIDAVVFTAGIGENSQLVREKVCSYLGFLGADFDPERNRVRGKEARISRDGSKVALYVIPTNEELVIARDTLALVRGK